MLKKKIKVKIKIKINKDYERGKNEKRLSSLFALRTNFARFKTIRRKHDLASAFGISNKIGGSHAFFRDN